MKLINLLLLCPLMASAQTNDGVYTRGIGQYPGRLSEYHGPAVNHCSNSKSQNLALHRAAWASTTVDYNLTAHLVTDGICDTSVPAQLVVSTPQGRLPRREAEWTLDGNEWSSNVLMGDKTWIELGVRREKLGVRSGGVALDPAIRKVVLEGRVAYDEAVTTKGYRIAWQTSDDGRAWTTIGELTGDGLPGTPLRYKLHSDPNKQTSESYLPARVLDGVELRVASEELGVRSGERHFRLLLEMEGAAYWDMHGLHFYDEAGQELWMQSSQQFSSMWMSDGGGKQWLKVDLGTACDIDSIVPRWYQEPRRWHHEIEDDGRAVRLVMEEPNECGYYALRELEVWGKSEKCHSSLANWQLQRASEVHATGEEIASADFAPDGWIPATVPGTVLTSFINIGAVPNPNYADWVDQISESYFRSNFWYRGIVTTSNISQQGKTILCFDGINWKANIFLNGVRLGRIEGAFQRGEFDVTGLLREGNNYVAVEIICNEHFGSVKEKNENTTQFNGGILGADNPTFHATIGWDWITTVRGREVGIWGDVYVKQVPGGVSLSDPYVGTELKPLPQPFSEKRGEYIDKSIRVTPSVFVKNHNATAVSGTLRGWIGDVTFEKKVTLPAQSEQEVCFSPEDFPQLTSSDFRLWWPNGYGEPYLYDAGFSLTPDPTSEPSADSSASKSIYSPLLGRGAGGEAHYKAGLRQMTYEQMADSLLVYINGRRFVPLGGNWGFAEHNLQYGRREYEAAVGYHRDMHCTMIRNWVGQTGDRAFYDVCDSLGIMIWQDFWLANPADGPDPYDDRLFLDNAEDYVRRIRQHAAIGIYCGRNEGYPPTNIDRKLRQFVSQLSPGLGYISSSADDGVTGHGPYCAQPAKVYFERQSGKIHTERGMPAVMNIESMRRTFAPDSLWPQSVQWGQHDYTLLGAQRALEFNALVTKAMGQSNDVQPTSQSSILNSQLEPFLRWAQLINYQGYRAMFESGSKTRSGLLIWMSHPCWPSMVWQTYDYYLDPTAAYFGVKKGCEPLHIQWNVLTDSIEVVNLFAGNHAGLTATATLYDVATGKRIVAKSARLTSGDDTTQPVLGRPQTNGQCALLRLQLKDKNAVLSTNDYFIEDRDGSYAAIAKLPEPTLTKQFKVLSEGEIITAELTLTNTGKTIAPFLRLNLKGEDGEQMLPVVYSDNYFTLMPGERRTVTVSWKREDSRGQQPVIEVTSL